MKMLDVIFFPGKNTPVKRYKSQFPTLNLLPPSTETSSRVILCHSIGVVSAIKFLEETKQNLPIVCIDTVKLPENVSQFSLYLFRRKNTTIKEDINLYKNVEFVDTENHFIHESGGNIRNKIVKVLEFLANSE